MVSVRDPRRAYSPPRVVRLDVESLTRAHVALGTLERELRDDGRRLAADAVQYADMCIVAMREALERQAKPPG